MSASRFWTFTSPEIKITRGGGGGQTKDKGGRDKGGGWTGRGKGGGWGKGGGDAGLFAATEEFTIGAGHGSNEYDILTIGGVAVENFSWISFSIRNLSMSGGTPLNVGWRLSNDGGSTWVSGATDYKHVSINAASDAAGDANFMKAADSAEYDDVNGIIFDLNAPVPTSMVAATQEMPTPTSPSRWTSVCVGDIAAHDALQFYLDQTGGSVFNGGVINIAGYY